VITQFLGDGVVVVFDLGLPILVTASTRAALGDANGFGLHPCGALPLKGIAAPVEIHGVDA